MRSRRGVCLIGRRNVALRAGQYRCNPLYSTDRLYGGAGNDQILGLQGNDPRLVGGFGDDFISGGRGDDRILGHGLGRGGLPNFEMGSDSLWGNAGDDQLVGGLGPDRLSGGSEDDLL